MRILIANRGEIARRIQRTAHCLGHETVAVWADPDLEEVTQRAATIARTLANADTGFMRSRIEGAIGFEGKQLAGVVFNGAEYGIWQETEPGDALPGGGARKRGGGRAHLRPGVLRALQEAGWI